MFKCINCGATSPEECECPNPNVDYALASNYRPLSLDELAAEVRQLCRDEAAALAEHATLRRLAEEARMKHDIIRRNREGAEQRMQEAYDEAVTP